MNIKSLLIGCAAAMIAMCGISSAAQLDPGSTLYAHPHDVGVAPQAGPKDGKLASGITGDDLNVRFVLGGTKVVKGDAGTIILAGFLRPNNPMPLVEKLAKRTSAQAPGGTKIVQPTSAEDSGGAKVPKPIDVTTQASADIPWPSIGGGGECLHIDTVI